MAHSVYREALGLPRVSSAVAQLLSVRPQERLEIFRGVFRCGDLSRSLCCRLSAWDFRALSL